MLQVTPSKMISFSNINKQYGKQLLFVDASFQLNPGEKVGLVGPNGAGKTTLFRMVVGEETPDEGVVSVPKKLTIGYFRQDVEEMRGRSVLDEAIAGSGRVGDLHHELEALQREMSDPDPDNIAPTVVWLGSRESREVSGCVFELEGGRLAIATGWNEGPVVDKGSRWEPREVGSVVLRLLAERAPQRPVYGA